MTDYAYKPRLGFDIRVRPPAKEAKTERRYTDDNRRGCDAPGCRERAQLSLARSPREVSERVWLCVAHATEHNARWNYFDGLSEEEADAQRQAAFYGDRPTWSFAKNERARTTANAKGPADFLDPFGFFAGARPRPEEQAAARRLPRLQAKAFETLGLAPTATAQDIRRRYAELVRRYHPDANGGDRGAEAQLTEVVRAHQLLKKARLC